MRLALLSGISLLTASYHLLMKAAADRIDPVLALVNLQAAALIVGLILCSRGGVWSKLAQQPLAGLGAALGAGVAVGLAEYLTFTAFEQGMDAARLVPIAIGGSVVLAALGGMVLFKEQVSPGNLVGIVLVAAGIWLVLGE